MITQIAPQLDFALTPAMVSGVVSTPGTNSQPDLGVAPARISNSALASGWEGLAGDSDYTQRFGHQGYVANGQDPQLLSLLQQAVQASPQLANSPLAQHVQAGQVGKSDVTALQQFLQAHGQSVGSTGADGLYGPRSHAALESYLNAPAPPAHPAQPAPAPVQQAAPAGAPPPSAGPIGPGTKVLQIGDSHTVGTYGTEMDKLLRGTGATVETVGSSGSSPSWYLNGTTTQSGFVDRKTDGSVDQPAQWNTPHATPKLQNLVAQDHPDVILVNLGANFRGASPQQIQQQVSSLAQVAQQSGAKLVWVGPPNSQKDMGNPASMNAFNQRMQAAVAPYGTYIPSSQFTPQYAGADGLHYSGTQGTAIAKSWAQGVFNQIQQG